MLTKRVYLKNNHTEDYDQTIHGERYFIKAGGQIELPRRKAIDVRGHYAQDEKGNRTEVSLELIPIPDVIPEPETKASNIDSLTDRIARLESSLAAKTESTKVYVCPCGKEYTDKKWLTKHMKDCGAINGGDDSSSNSE